MARRVKPNFLPGRGMAMGERGAATAGANSLPGDESREDGSEDSERGDMGLPRGEEPAASPAPTVTP